MLTLIKIYLDNLNSGSCNSPRMSSHQLFLPCKSVKSIELTLQQFVNSVHIWQSFPCIIIKMHNHVTISDEMSLIYTLLYTEVLKMYQKTCWSILTWKTEDSIERSSIFLKLTADKLLVFKWLQAEVQFLLMHRK